LRPASRLNRVCTKTLFLAQNPSKRSFLGVFS
jgi:hypothetical protein